MRRKKKPLVVAVDLDAVQDRPVAPQDSFDAWCGRQDTALDHAVRALDGAGPGTR